MLAPLLFLALDPFGDLLKWMDTIAQAQLNIRDSKIAAIRTRNAAEERTSYVRASILQSIGGLPDNPGPLNPHITGRIDAGGFTIEKVIFESFPRYFVTANLYTPKSSGRHPAILFPLGHWIQGKSAAQRMAANFALKGFVVLAYDPVGQGERLQAFDARVGDSLAGGSVEQHNLAGAQSLLVGQSFARYRIWDARRALDYLSGRPEVDADRIGVTGCSGGGTVTTYIAALDPRIRVAAPACYMNSFRLLFTGPTGDAEQSLPGFLSAGLDLADYIELFAPKPWLMTSTEDDFFRPAGAKIAYDEARHWYELYGAADRIKWVVGPGGHGTPRQVREAIYEWMIRWLNDGKGSAVEEDVSLRPDFDLRVTRSGQVSENPQSRDLYEIIRDSARAQTGGGLVEWLKQLIDHHAPASVTRSPDGNVTFQPDMGLTLTAKLIAPPKAASRRAATLVVQENLEVTPATQALVDSGEIVLIVAPRGLPAPRSRELPGDWITNIRASLIGRNLATMRAHDILCAIDILAAQPDADAARISARASNVAGVWLLFAAAVDPRIARVSLDHTPHSLREALNRPLTRNLFDAVVPGLALRGDLADLVQSIAPRPVIWTDPTDWMENVVQLPGFRYSTFAQ